MCESCNLAFSLTVLQSIMNFCWQCCVVCSCMYSVNDRPFNVTLSGWTVRPSHQPIATRYFRSSVAEDSVLLGYDALSVSNRIWTFRSKLNVVIFNSMDVLEENSQASQDRTTKWLSFVITALFWPSSFVILSVCLIHLLLLLVVVRIKFLTADSRIFHCCWSWRLLHWVALGSLIDGLFVV
jgi:hypothetical protein